MFQIIFGQILAQETETISPEKNTFIKTFQTPKMVACVINKWVDRWLDTFHQKYDCFNFPLKTDERLKYNDDKNGYWQFS